MSSITPPPLLRQTGFRRFWLGQTFSVLGDQVTLLAIPLAAVVTLDASAGDMGLLTAAGLAPHLLFSLPFGAWLDRRRDRRRLMILADLGRAALLSTIPLVWALDALSMPHLYAIVFLVGVLTVVFDLGWSTLFAALVPRERYIDANSLLMQSRAVSYAAGPSLGGLLVELVRAPLALGLDALSFVASACFLYRVDVVEPEPAEEEPGRRLGRMADGFRFIARAPAYRAALGATATINFFNFMLFALFVLYATRELNVAPGALGLVLGAGAVGSIVGATVAGRVGRRIGVGPAFAAGCVLFPLPLVLIPLARGGQATVLVLLFAAEFLCGVGVMLLDVNGNAINTALTPDRLRARVAGAHRFVNYGLRPVGSLVGGALGATIGLRPTLWIATVGALAGVLWLLPSPILRLRELPDEAA